MDTVKIAIEDSDAAKWIRTQVRIKGFPHHSRKSKHQREAREFGYRRGGAFDILGKYVHISWSPKKRKKPKPPKKPRPPLAPLLLTTHLSNFEDDEHGDTYAFFRWAQAGFGIHTLTAILDGRIKRLDTAIDVEMDIDTAEDEIIQPRARAERQVRSRTKTIYWGRLPRLTRAYEREVPRCRLDHNLSEDGDPGEIIKGVRIEADHRRKKILIQRLRDVEQLRHINPFSHLEFLNQTKTVIASDTPIKTKYKLLAFQKRCEQVGAQAARKEFNQDRNFKRTVERYLVQTKDFNFEMAWKRRIERFLGPSPVRFPDETEGGHHE